MSDSESGTERVGLDEIAAALKGLGCEIRMSRRPYNGWEAVNSESAARQIVGWVREHREPEYVPGEVYLDAVGRKLLRLDNAEWPWAIVVPSEADRLQFGKWGHAEFLGESVPVRPLQRLVPIEEARDGVYCQLDHYPEGA